MESTAYETLVEHHARLHRLWHLQAIASWDRLVGMPPGGASARAAAQGELAALIQSRQADPALPDLLKTAEAQSGALDDDARANLREMRRAWQQAHALPAELMRRRQAVTGACSAAWPSQRKANDWAAFAATFAPVVAVAREEAEVLGQAAGCSRYDALLDRHVPGVSSTWLTGVFEDIANWMPGLLERATALQAGDDVIEPVGPFSIDAQRRVCETVMGWLGFDFAAGRLDTSVHPFTGGVPEDVRLTTRFSEASFLPALMGTIHETGHAVYQQQLPKAWLGQPIGEPRSAAVHEGRALFFERQLGAHPGFLARLARLLQDTFGMQPALAEENLKRLLTHVRPGRLRVAADELSYLPHIILRVEIEQALIEAEIEIDDIPAWWDDRMKRMLDIDTRGDFANGPLQDAHWPSGMFGYFPAYLLGAMYAAQWFEAMRRTLPRLDEEIAAGDLRSMIEWLNVMIGKRASRWTADVMLRHATGKSLTSTALRDHLIARYGEVV